MTLVYDCDNIVKEKTTWCGADFIYRRKNGGRFFVIVNNINIPVDCVEHTEDSHIRLFLKDELASAPIHKDDLLIDDVMLRL